MARDSRTVPTGNSAQSPIGRLLQWQRSRTRNSRSKVDRKVTQLTPRGRERVTTTWTARVSDVTPTKKIFNRLPQNSQRANFFARSDQFLRGNRQVFEFFSLSISTSTVISRPTNSQVFQSVDRLGRSFTRQSIQEPSDSLCMIVGWVAKHLPRGRLFFQANLRLDLQVIIRLLH